MFRDDGQSLLVTPSFWKCGLVSVGVWFALCATTFL